MWSYIGGRGRLDNIWARVGPLPHPTCSTISTNSTPAPKWLILLVVPPAILSQDTSEVLRITFNMRSPPVVARRETKPAKDPCNIL